MQRTLLLPAVMLVSSVYFFGTASGAFDQKLSPDQQILHALNRLTFGPRPGDVEEVRHLGLEKWIDLQLHPERIPETPIIDAKLKPFETLRMAPAEIMKAYAPMQILPIMRPVAINQLLSGEQLRFVQTGTVEERKKVLDSLDAEKRKQVLTVIAPNLLLGAPDLLKEADDARKMQQQEQQMQIRKQRPQLQDLLSAEQMQTALRGSPEQLTALFEFLDPVKREQVAAVLPPQTLAAFPEMRRLGMKRNQPQNVLSNDLKEAKVFRALYSKRQLEEVLVDFWFNHFNVYDAKQVQVANNPYRALLASYERDAIRPHVFGKFKDLLLATARHPAMLFYLDNWESIAPDAVEALQVGPFAAQPGNLNNFARQAHGLNENYGREVMELHTLGVDGGYTQADVIAVARCFTGWTIRKPGENPEFAFSAFMHDNGEKTVLGHKIAAGGGEQDGLQVIDILAHHPSTAKFISKQLARRFVADDPPQPLVDRMAQTFTKTDGDLRAVMQTMFNSSEFFSQDAWESKVKSPLEMVVSAVRALNGEAIDAFSLAQRISDLGAPLYSKLEPNGYPEDGQAWLSTGSLLSRMNFATALASGQIPGVKLDSSRLDGKDVAAIARELLGRDVSPQTEAAISKGVEGKDATPRYIASLVIGSPDFQK